MKKKFLATLLCGTMLFCTSSFTFASDEMENQEPLTPNIIENGGDSGIILFSSHDKTVQVYISTSSGTSYNKARTKKCVWTEAHYKVYYENMATHNRRFQYDKYNWSWKGYKKSGSSWVFVTKSSGTNRVHTDASNIGSWLMSF